ncbi:hypothetical protein [Sphingobacterium multivorum]|uniref:hypothetical protein n=1 Tax=Sphingobacterium TaxID=28453 RepID=UPI002FDA5003
MNRLKPSQVLLFLEKGFQRLINYNEESSLSRSIKQYKTSIKHGYHFRRFLGASSVLVRSLFGTSSVGSEETASKLRGKSD